MRIKLLFLWGILLATSCRPGVEVPETPLISVSILPQQYFIEQLAGELVEVNVMIPPGASPATYEPTVSQLGKLDQSSVYMRIGYIGFEQSWMDKLSSVNPHMKIVDLSRGVDIIMEDTGLEDDSHGHAHDGHSHQGMDPHIWMSAINVRIIAENIHRELLLLFPEEEEYLIDRLNRFSGLVDSLHLAVSGRLQGMKSHTFMIYHPALTYYARDYGLEQIALEKGGKSPSPAHLKEITDQARENAVNKILIQSQFDVENAKILARETGSEIIQFDPLDLHWSDQMYYIAEQLNPKPK